MGKTGEAMLEGPGFYSMKSSKKCLGQNLLTPFELIFPKMNILELGGFGLTAEIYIILTGENGLQKIILNSSF